MSKSVVPERMLVIIAYNPQRAREWAQANGVTSGRWIYCDDMAERARALTSDAYCIVLDPPYPLVQDYLDSPDNRLHPIHGKELRIWASEASQRVAQKAADVMAKPFAYRDAILMAIAKRDNLREGAWQSPWYVVEAWGSIYVHTGSGVVTPRVVASFGRYDTAGVANAKFMVANDPEHAQRAGHAHGNIVQRHGPAAAGASVYCHHCGPNEPYPCQDTRDVASIYRIDWSDFSCPRATPPHKNST